MQDYSADKAKINPRAISRLKKSSETFRGLLELRDNDLEGMSMLNISRAIRGIPAVKDSEGNIKTPAILGDVGTSKWFIDLYGSKAKNDENDGIGIAPPRNQKEADLLESLLNKHSDYVRSKRNKRNTKG